MAAARKVHWEIGQTGTTGCGQPTKRRTTSSALVDVTCPGCLSVAQAEASTTTAKTGVTATIKPPVIEGTLKGDDLIARKRLAGAGRSQESGTTFGSKWTQAERDELQRLYDEHGRVEGVTTFLEAHPHRTRHGCLYQLERHLTKSAKAPKAKATEAEAVETVEAAE